jgi:hypothetical protein
LHLLDALRRRELEVLTDDRRIYPGLDPLEDELIPGFLIVRIHAMNIARTAAADR